MVELSLKIVIPVYYDHLKENIAYEIFRICYALDYQHGGGNLTEVKYWENFQTGIPVPPYHPKLMNTNCPVYNNNNHFTALCLGLPG